MGSSIKLIHEEYMYIRLTEKDVPEEHDDAVWVHGTDRNSIDSISTFDAQPGLCSQTVPEQSLRGKRSVGGPEDADHLCS